MNNNNTPPRLYALTPIDQTKGLEYGQYRLIDKYGKESDSKYSFDEGKWIAEKYVTVEYPHYLCPLPEGTLVLKPGELDMAIEFHEWVGKQGYKLSHYAAKGEAVHLHESKGSTQFHELKDNDYCTTKELYQQFIQTKLAQMGE